MDRITTTGRHAGRCSCGGDVQFQNQCFVCLKCSSVFKLCCSNCDKENQLLDCGTFPNFCLYCGRSLRASGTKKKCLKCSALLPLQANFCSLCGTDQADAIQTKQSWFAIPKSLKNFVSPGRKDSKKASSDFYPSEHRKHDPRNYEDGPVGGGPSTCFFFSAPSKNAPKTHRCSSADSGESQVLMDAPANKQGFFRNVQEGFQRSFRDAKGYLRSSASDSHVYKPRKNDTQNYDERADDENDLYGDEYSDDQYGKPDELQSTAEIGKHSGNAQDLSTRTGMSPHDSASPDNSHHYGQSGAVGQRVESTQSCRVTRHVQPRDLSVNASQWSLPTTDGRRSLPSAANSDNRARERSMLADNLRKLTKPRPNE